MREVRKNVASLSRKEQKKNKRLREKQQRRLSKRSSEDLG